MRYRDGRPGWAERGLSILLHPGTGDACADHTDHAVWFGGVLPLRLDVLRKA
jgi:aromatic ring-cleaving dioxygenase